MRLIFIALCSLSLAAGAQSNLQICLKNPATQTYQCSASTADTLAAPTAIGATTPAPSVATKVLNLQGVSPATGPNGNQIQQNTPCNGLGFSLGNNGTSAEGWSGCSPLSQFFGVAQEGIHQMSGGFFDKPGKGDTAISYKYLTPFGGATASSDEGVAGTVTQINQRGFTSGLVTAGATVGSEKITAGSLGCTGYCMDARGVLGNVFNAGGMLLDTRAPLTTATILDCAGPTSQGTCTTSSTGLNGMYYDITGGTVPVSTAWGNIIPSSCTYRTLSLYKVLEAITCKVQVLSPAGFVAGQHINLSGPFQEEAAATAVGPLSLGVQSITFTTTVAWDNMNGNPNGALVMQGGPGGEAFIVAGTLGTWPIAWHVVGATSPTRIYFSNCSAGSCNGLIGSTIPYPSGANFQYGSMARVGGIVTLTGMNQSYAVGSYGVGASFVVNGAFDPSFNGTFTVVSSTLDEFNPVITWAQAGLDATINSFNVARTNPQITLYPMAFITGTNNGQQGVAQLGTNHIPFALGDSVISAPTSEYSALGIFSLQGQRTPSEWGGSKGIFLTDVGPYPPMAQIVVQNLRSNGTQYVAPVMFSAAGGYHNYFQLDYRPAHNGAIISVGGGDPVAGATDLAYRLFEDKHTAIHMIIRPKDGVIEMSPISSSTVATVYDAAGTFLPYGHMVRGVVTVAGAATDVIPAAGFSNKDSYSCSWSAETIISGSTNVPLTYASGSRFTIDGSYGSGFNGVARYTCTGN